MRFKYENTRKKLLPGVIPLAIILVILLLPNVVEAAQYYVWGRVYSASPLAEGEEEPPNPLKPLPSGHEIIGDDLVAQIPRNLVKVKVLATSNGNELGNDIVTYDGGYLVSFNAGGTTVSIKFVVEELATTKILLESEAVTLSQWQANNIYYLLVPESLTEIGSDREFCTKKCPTVGGKYTGIFTRVGKIEVATEVGSTTQHLIDPKSGLVTVPDTVASQLKIHPYKKSPLGGNLYIFGAFSQKLYSKGKVYYRIKIENPDATFTPITPTYMNDPLYKTKYTIDFNTLKVKTERIKVGPHSKIIGFTLYHNLYELTPLSSGTGSTQEFWSFPDLVALWSTGTLSGKYKLTLEVVGVTGYCIIPKFTELTMKLDNERPVARILPLENKPYPITMLTEDTPLIYTPGPAVPTPYNLEASRLKDVSKPATEGYGPETNPLCAILDFTTSNQHLAFKLSAHHSNGYMRYWYFSFMRNNVKVYHKIIGKSFDGTSMQDYGGLRITTCSESSQNGFENKFLYLNPGHVDLGSNDACGYRFVIWAATRSTDGYDYLYWSHDEDIHYLRYD